MYPLSLFNLCYGCTCPEMRTTGAFDQWTEMLGFIIVSISFSTFSAKNAHFTSVNKTEQIKFPPLSSKEQQWVGALPSAASIFFTFIIVMPLCRKYHRILRIQRTFKVHTVFSHALAKVFPTESREDILAKKINHNLPTVHGHFGMPSITNLNAMRVSLSCPTVMTLEVNATTC